MYGNFPARNAVHTPFLLLYAWFWPTLQMHNWVTTVRHTTYARQQSQNYGKAFWELQCVYMCVCVMCGAVALPQAKR